MKRTAKMTRRSALVLAVTIASGCTPSRKSSGAVDPRLRHDLELTDEQAAYLEGLARAADERPDDFEARKESGLAHMWFTLSGALSMQTRAEQDLEAAFALDPSDRLLTRSLGRFYNLRAVAGDDSKAPMQVKVYRAHLGDEPVEHMDTAEFVAWSFFELGQVLEHRNDGRLLAALGRIKDLEEALEQRARAFPDDIELHALAGNFAFFFAGNVPFDREDRVEAGVAYFTHVRNRWDELRAGAKDPYHCPNTYENFMFELAEGHLVLEQVEPATAIYEELKIIRPPRTRAKEQIAFVATERLHHLDAYVGDMDLMPPWPSDEGNCVVCHAYTSDVPLTTLHSESPITLDDIPTAAEPKPIRDAASVPDDVTSLLQRRCAPCHLDGGKARHLADFSSRRTIAVAAERIGSMVESGKMPPDAPLPEHEQAIISAWLSR